MAGRPPASGICIVPLPSWQNAALFHIGFKRAVGEDTGGGMGSFRLFCFVSVFSNAELVLQGFLHLPHHRFVQVVKFLEGLDGLLKIQASP